MSKDLPSFLISRCDPLASAEVRLGPLLEATVMACDGCETNNLGLGITEGI